MDTLEKTKGILTRENDPTNENFIFISTHICRIKKGQIDSFVFKDKLDCDVKFQLSFENTNDNKPSVRFNLKDPATMEMVFKNINETKLVKTNNRIPIGTYQKTKELFLNFVVYPIVDGIHNVIVEFYFKK